MISRNISTVRFGDDVCFVMIDDTMDFSPFFLYWFYEIWKRKEHIIAGSRTGTGLAPYKSLWKRFMRSKRKKHHKNIMQGFLDFFRMRNFTLITPPLLNGYTIVRAEHQSPTEMEKEPKMTRIWDEDFIIKSNIQPL